MPRFYFIDSNLILGYCNPYDRLRSVAVRFFEAIPNKRHIYLLYSVEKEYYRKIRLVRNDFEKKITRLLSKQSSLPVTETRTTFLNDPVNLNRSFEKYIFEIFNEKKFTEINHPNLMTVLSLFISRMRSEFKQLIIHWIVRPKANDFESVLSDQIFITYKNKIEQYIHYPDSQHLALACYIITNRRSEDHDYIFYTDDNQYFINNLERMVNVSNLKVKKISYTYSTKLEYSELTKSFSNKIDVLEFSQDNDLI